MKEIKVVELFAGVGGFRLGLSKSEGKFKTIFSNQWEPNKKPESQYAFKALRKNFIDEEDTLNNEDIAIAKYKIPFGIDLLVGGFPCQDYSVAATKAKGIQGKKGVLWWEISWILQHRKPKMVLLENVDRILKCPSDKRGRDFAIILKNLDKLGYNVEWKVINAAAYGEAQKRKRIFIFAWNRKTKINKTKNKNIFKLDNRQLNFESFFFREFPSEVILDDKNNMEIVLNDFSDEIEVMNNWGGSKFHDDGLMINGKIKSFKTKPKYDGPFKKMKDIIIDSFDEKLLFTEEQFEKIKYMKGSKSIKRVNPIGETYTWKEGAMNLYDSLEKPSRTMLTSESTLNRSTHVIKISENKYRKISPIEAERLNGFDDNWTADVMPERMRYFCMGNALVINLITKMGNEIHKIIENEE
ncbi:DNA (cytosine-5-)-methyltransferase [Mesoplasma florum]|uniref:DNA (cytosine-5-)-methyltransferase n=1 Tax=Mesoplasma florum TaxID=2151 RepID=UPI000D02A5AB|nr:DNA (cytosine-5-)-methyltransferase [Mesoplasma florum]AVN58939.1 DNA (cytosine-5-)-methyltransferase [Mesoplasma florum]